MVIPPLLRSTCTIQDGYGLALLGVIRYESYGSSHSELQSDRDLHCTLVAVEDFKNSSRQAIIYNPHPSSSIFSGLNSQSTNV
jgi:hypothetical protein